MKNNLQKIEAIHEKLKQLKAEKNAIEQKLLDNVGQVLKVQEAFQIDFDCLVGGILETIDTIRSDPVKMEAWRVTGKKFRKSSLMPEQNRAKKFDSNVEVEHV